MIEIKLINFLIMLDYPKGRGRATPLFFVAKILQENGLIFWRGSFCIK